jgi:hypothetical protein
MNEHFAAEPICFRTFAEFRSLVKQFGPEAGRYLTGYPSKWSELVSKTLLTEEVRDVELTKIKRALQMAYEQHRVIDGALPYDDSKPWLQNAMQLMSQFKKFDAVVSAEEATADKVYTLESIDIPPIAEEKMEAHPNEFARVVQTLVQISNELIFVDPFANPCKADVYVVLLAILKLVARSKCSNVVIFARENILLRNHDTSELRQRLSQLKKDSELPARCMLSLQLFDDDRTEIKVHARYLLSKEGGIRFDQGFHKLGAGKKVDVAPLTQATLKPALDVYVEGKHDMVLSQLIRV